MPIEDFIISVYCCVDDNWEVINQGKRLRQRGYAPQLSDQKSFTMEIVGESLELVNKSSRETRRLQGVSGKARESQYLGV